MDQVSMSEADVMDRVCIDPEAVSRWMQLLEQEAGSAEAMNEMPQERATVESDGRLKVSVDWRGRSITMHCAAREWAWAHGGRQ